jgi:uncharacterized protein YndB with AHSA1/START domain
MSNTLKVTTPTDREILMTRVFDAPRELVWDAHTRPELVKQWMLGPPGWSMPVCEIDLRVGGRLRYVWRNNDGREMGLNGVYREITPTDRLVHTELFDEDWTGGETVVTTLFTENSGKTTLAMTVRYASREVRDNVLKSGMETGVAESFDRLDEIFAAQMAENARRT